MGNLIWHVLGRLIALTSGLYNVWANIWGIAYRKYFWMVIGGTLGPHGLVPSPSFPTFLLDISVTFPLLQIINIVFGLFTLLLEWPLPFLVGSSLHRSFTFRAVTYFFFAFFAVQIYQSVDAAAFYLAAAAVYVRAIALAEEMPEAAVNRGKGSEA